MMLNAFLIDPITRESVGHAVPWNHCTTELIADRIPLHTGTITFRHSQLKAFCN